MDENNKKIAIQISYEKYGDILDDLIDLLLVEDRREEESIPFSEVLDELRNTGNLSKYVPD